MTSKRRESIGEDWEELESVASVVSFDGSSRSASPAPLEAKTPAIAAPTTEELPRTGTQRLPLRPKNDEIEKPESCSPDIVSTPVQPDNVLSNESRFPRHLQDDDTVPSFKHQNATTPIWRESEDAPLIRNGKACSPPPEYQEQKSSWSDDSVPNLESGYDNGPDDGELDPIDDPKAHHKACTETITMLDNVAKLAHDLGGHRVSTMSHIRQMCERLSLQAKELQKMLETYANHWIARGCKDDTSEIPLSPDVWELLSQLKKKLSSTTTELRGVEPIELVVLEVQDIPLRVNSTLARCGESLENISTFLAEFLPIMRVDFDEFRTTNMTFPPATTDPSQKTGRHSPPRPSTSRIRQELYALKDSLASLSAFLTQLKSDPCFDYHMDAAVTRSAESIVEAITKTLTNNPSEWIDSMLSEPGELSYAQFQALDAEILHDVTSHVKACQEELDIVPEEDRAMYSREMIRECQLDLLRHGEKLDEIKSLIEFVKQLLLIP
ncbi:hypothetical protein FLONG3_5740 [Fusarium longipes]|uniref:Uncharacterized protein n=1 Tax=Fusarium longipes TaxID=694270 RepID=A0A395SS96_9HYPO|nr:hypothetical protein FLONG3_5740 [Fusarium longipes]